MSNNTNDKEYLLREEKVGPALQLMVIPAMIAAAVNQLNIIIDTFFLGNFAAPETSNAAQIATSNAMTIAFLMNALSFMVAIGTAIFVTQKIGMGDKVKAQRYMANSFVAGWIIYGLTLILVVPILDSFVGLLTGGVTGEAIYDNSYAYIMIMLLGFPTIMFQQLSSQSIRAEGKSKLIMKVSILGVIINMIVNYLLIADTSFPLSLHGTNIEAAGAAAATVVSQFVMMMILMSVLFKKEKTNYYINLKNVKFEKEWFSIFKSGIPQFSANIFLAVGTFLVSFSIAKLYEVGIFDALQFEAISAASGITIRLVLMMFLLVNGAIQGIQGFVAYQYGAGYNDRLLESIKMITRAAIWAGALFCATYFFFAPQIAAIFSQDPIVIEYVTYAMKGMSLALLVMPIGSAYFGLFAALGKPQLALGSSLFRDGLMLSGSSIILPWLFGAEGVMLVFAFAIGVGSTLIAIIGYFVVKGIEEQVENA